MSTPSSTLSDTAAASWLRGRRLLLPAAAVVGGAAVASTTLGPLVVVGVVALAALFLVPVRWLPVLGLFLFLTPWDNGPDIHSVVRLTAVCLPMLAYYLRRRSQLSWSFGVAWTASWLVVVGVVSAMQGLRPLPSVLFLVPVVVLVVVPAALRGMPADDQRLLIRAWAFSAIGLAAFGLVEFVARMNPLDSWYALAVSPLVQKWDVYRIATTIGHPLLNGMFFAAAFALCCWQLLDRSAISGRTAAVGMVASLGATVLSGSRSALVAVAAGGVVVSLAATSQHRAQVKWALRLVLPVGVLIAFYYLWTLRLGGAEADESTEVRRGLFETASALISQRWLLGAGPGYAWEQNELYGTLTGYALESSALELVVGWGVLGVATALVVGLVYVVSVVRRGRVVALAPLTAVATSSLFFNFIEGDPKGMLLVCSAVLITAVPLGRGDAVPGVERPPGVAAAPGPPPLADARAG